MKKVNPTRLAQILLANIAQKMLDGEISYIEGSRQIIDQRLIETAKIHHPDKDALKIIAIDSETDTLPFGSVREFWQPEVLADLIPEIEHAEKWAQDFGCDACKRLVERFKEK